MLGMFWLGDGYAGELIDNAPAAAAECVYRNTGSPRKQHAATVSLSQRMVDDTQAVARAGVVFAFDTTPRTRLRPQRHTVRGPPYICS